MAVGAAAVVLSLPATSAWAHGELVEARPTPGSTVGGEVIEIELLFEEDVSVDGLSLGLIDPDGTALSVGTAELPVGSLVRASVAGVTKPGPYRVEYVVRSRDGFSFEGAYVFTYAPDATPVDPLPHGRSAAGLLLALGGGGLVLFVAIGWVLMRRRIRLAAGSDVAVESTRL